MRIDCGASFTADERKMPSINVPHGGAVHLARVINLTGRHANGRAIIGNLVRTTNFVCDVTARTASLYAQRNAVRRASTEQSSDIP